MECNFKVPAETILVQIVDGIRLDPTLSKENKEQAIKGVEMVILAFRAPKNISGKGGIVHNG